MYVLLKRNVTNCHEDHNKNATNIVAITGGSGKGVWVEGTGLGDGKAKTGKTHVTLAVRCGQVATPFDKILDLLQGHLPLYSLC